MAGRRATGTAPSLVVAANKRKLPVARRQPPSHTVPMPAEDLKSYPPPRTSASTARLLVDSYREFSGFLADQVGSGAVAAEILQEAFVRGMHKLELSHSDESTVDWFYRLLRHAVIEGPRPSGSSEHKLMTFRAELEQKLEPSVAAREAIDRYVRGLVATLEPEQAALLRSVESNDVASGVTEPADLSESAAAVRMSSARAALRRQVVSACGTCAVHDRWNCTCGSRLAGYGHAR
jgi:DNA-directed RNA polymerase specialized sigma24 family protein